MNFTKTVAAAAIILATAAGAFAHSGAKGVVKERMELMKDIARQMKIVGGMVKGEAQFDAGAMSRAALAIASHADEIPQYFPEGSLEAPSEALPVIWKDWDTFLELTDDFQEKAIALSKSAASATDVAAIRPQFLELGKTCSTCHREFRKAD
ncbi:cytochrome c [Hoeflea sp. WL0058]|uniref:Cytochrome c n=1 Tax=Flavimaribacter sediminis TaxID=2865987 RepID=A0AAE2ZJT9_9HYPH|nr:cytochrome c [Flavimaribacter sediminis]MBW8637818.1 cytochrome c [Flavimaribacter sediminis]